MADSDIQVEQVLMLVKTYPTPSATYGELVCTAGIRLRDNAWIRIYPYPFRLLNEDLRFRKGDILELPLLKATDDPRPESYKIHDANAIKRVDHLGTQHHWAERMKYILPTTLKSVDELKQGMFPADKVWGPSILPVKVKSGSAKFSYEGKGDWTEQELDKLRKAEEYVQTNLFVDEGIRQYFRMLEKVPYQFRLSYIDAAGEQHKRGHMILDWEIAQLYFNVRKNTQTDEEALEKVRYKIEEDIFSEKNDVFLVLGNIHHRFRNPNSLAIDGFFYPKRQLQPGLF